MAKNSQEKTIKENEQIINQQEEQIDLSKKFEQRLDAIADKALKIKKAYQDTVKETSSIDTILKAIETKRDSSIDNVRTLDKLRKDSEKEELKALKDYNKLLTVKNDLLMEGYSEKDIDDLIGDELEMQEAILGERMAQRDVAEDLYQIGLKTARQDSLRLKQAKDLTPTIEAQAEAAKKFGNNVNSFITSLPFGGALSKIFGLDNLGTEMEKGVTNNLAEVGEGAEKTKGMFSSMGAGMVAAIQSVGAAFKANPYLFTIGAIISLALAYFKFKKEVRDLGNEMGVTAAKAQDMYLGLRRAETELKVMGFDSAKLKTTLTEMSSTFGSLENVTVENAKNIEKMAQEMGIAGQDVVKFSKVMMDLTGESFDTATNMAKIAANMAAAANVSTDKVMKDMQTSAERFAEYSMQGAEGMAQAAIEAAKVGSELKGILDAADSLLKFETSITSQFEAQVLTGKMINTERARQLALDGDIAGLTTEIQSIVGQVGDIQELNVIQRKSVAEAIGISVQDLMRISRGEAMQERQSVQEVITKEVGKTNELLAKIHKVDLESLDVAKDKVVTINEKMY